MSRRGVHATRWRHFRAQLAERFTAYALLVCAAIAIGAGSIRSDPTAAATVFAFLALMLVGGTWLYASGEAEEDFFRSFAPELGLQYVASWSIPARTPLLSAGERQDCEHAMEGPLFGALGGPTLTLTHFSFKTTQPGGEGGTQTVSHPFTVAAMEVEAALPMFHGVYLRRRPKIRIPMLWDDWLARAHAEEVDLESTDFEELYELRATRDQDRSVLHQLFSPSFIVWLAEHPLHPGLECKGGMLVVFIPEHENDPDRLILLHEAARDITRRVMAAVEAERAATPAG